MNPIISLLLPTAVCMSILRLLRRPVRWLLYCGIHALGGFFCLWSLNLVSGITGITLPINPVTVTVSGVLGLPGILGLLVLELL